MAPSSPSAPSLPPTCLPTLSSPASPPAPSAPVRSLSPLPPARWAPVVVLTDHMTAVEAQPAATNGAAHELALPQPGQPVALDALTIDVPTAIRTRRTIRQWTDRPVSEEIVKELLECALWAPSACNMQ